MSSSAETEAEMCSSALMMLATQATQDAKYAKTSLTPRIKSEPVDVVKPLTPLPSPYPPPLANPSSVMQKGILPPQPVTRTSHQPLPLTPPVLPSTILRQTLPLVGIGQQRAVPIQVFQPQNSVHMQVAGQQTPVTIHTTGAPGQPRALSAHVVNQRVPVSTPVLQQVVSTHTPTTPTGDMYATLGINSILETIQRKQAAHNSMASSQPTNNGLVAGTCAISTPTMTLPVAMPVTMEVSIPAQPTNLPTSLPARLPASLPTSLPARLPASLPARLPTSSPTILPTNHTAADQIVMNAAMPSPALPAPAPVRSVHVATGNNGVPISKPVRNNKPVNLPKLKMPSVKMEIPQDDDSCPVLVKKEEPMDAVQSPSPHLPPVPLHQPQSPSVAMLPPCTVCGEKASGFHYGANTCQACKGFFRRCLLRKQDYVCSYSDKCIVRPGRRNGCAACRYRKCLTAGMAKTAIKTGRYTHEKRTRDIEEVKKLELQSRMKDDGTLAQSSEERNVDLEKVIKSITEIHMEQIPQLIMATVTKKEHEYLEKRNLDEQLHGRNRVPISREQFEKIYKETGVDVDNRQALLARMLRSLDVIIKRLITFAKVLPGFRELPLEDQVALIKSSVLEWWVLMYSHWHNTDEMICVQPGDLDLVMCLEDMHRFNSNKEDIDELWKIIARVQALELTEQEQAMSIALCVIIGDAEISRVGRLIVSASQDYILEALDYLIRKNHDPDERILAKLMSIITSLRSLQGFTDDTRTNIARDADLMPGVELPGLYKQIFGGGESKPNDLSPGTSPMASPPTSPPVRAVPIPMTFQSQVPLQPESPAELTSPSPLSTQPSPMCTQPSLLSTQQTLSFSQL